MQELQCALLEADVFISSTGATGFVIDYELMQFVERIRKGKPIFMVDIAVPRMHKVVYVFHWYLRQSVKLKTLR